MKRVLTILMVLCLLIVLPASAENSREPLSAQELTDFSQALVERAIAEEAEVEPSEDGWEADGHGYTLRLSSQDLSVDSVLLGAAIGMDSLHTEGLVGPRGIGVAASLDEVLAAYPNDNPTLSGSMYAAVLYVAGALPERVAIGQLTRDGQEISLVEYSVIEPSGEGYVRSGLQYTLQHGSVVAIRSFASPAQMDAEAAQAAVQAATSLQEQTDYFAYDTKAPGPFIREDLKVAGLDFIDMTPEDASAVLGEVVHEERVKDSNGEELRLMQWDGIEIAFVYLKDGSFKRAERASVTGYGIEGPRGLRVGGQLMAAMSRFEHEGELSLNSGSLYGKAEAQQPPYGTLISENNSAQLYYALTQDDQTILLGAQFIEGSLVEYSISY